MEIKFKRSFLRHITRIR